MFSKTQTNNTRNSTTRWQNVPVLVQGSLLFFKIFQSQPCLPPLITQHAQHSGPNPIKHDHGEVHAQVIFLDQGRSAQEDPARLRHMSACAKKVGIDYPL